MSGVTQLKNDKNKYDILIVSNHEADLWHGSLP